MLIFKFDSQEESDQIISQINNDKGFPKTDNTFKGEPNHRKGVTSTYCDVIELDNGFGIIADAVTRQYVTDREPIEYNPDPIDNV